MPLSLRSLAVLPLLAAVIDAAPFHKDIAPPKEWEHLAQGGRFRDLKSNIPANCLDYLNILHVNARSLNKTMII